MGIKWVEQRAYKMVVLMDHLTDERRAEKMVDWLVERLVAWTGL